MSIVSPVQDAISRMERRFITASFIPVVMFLGSLGLCVVLASDARDEIVFELQHLDVSSQIGLAFAFLLLSWFLAGLLSSNWRKIVRLYEGYPIRRFVLRRAGFQMWYRIPGVRWHLMRRSVSNSTERYSRYPDDAHISDVLPTTIGNILIAAERYGLARYGLDVNLLWTRLYWQLPPEMRQNIDVAKEEHQIPLALSFVAGCFGVISGICILILRGSAALFAGATVSGFVLAVIAYLLAIERTEEYGEQIRTTVDLHRRLLVRNWAEGPRNYRSDREYFAAAAAFVESGVQLAAGGPDLSVSDVVPNSPPPVPGYPESRNPGAHRLRGALRSPTGFLLNRIAGLRLLHTAILLMTAWAFAGTIVCAYASRSPAAAETRVLTLPLAPSLSNEFQPAANSVVDVIVQPCGVVLRDVRMERLTNGDDSSSNVQLLSVQIAMGQLRALEGCAPTALTVLVI